MANHWITLPHPAASDTDWVATLVSTRSDAASERWTAYHFLYGSCPCSRRVLRRVVQLKPHDQVVERIVLIGEDAEMEANALKLGYEVDCVTPEQLETKYGVASAPFLVVVTPYGEAAYAGGYTSRKQGLDVRHADIIARLVEGQSIESLPVYGCAVSDELKNIVDPLGLKY